MSLESKLSAKQKKLYEEFIKIEKEKTLKLGSAESLKKEFLVHLDSMILNHNKAIDQLYRERKLIEKDRQVISKMKPTQLEKMINNDPELEGALENARRKIREEAERIGTDEDLIAEVADNGSNPEQLSN